MFVGDKSGKSSFLHLGVQLGGQSRGTVMSVTASLGIFGVSVAARYSFLLTMLGRLVANALECWERRQGKGVAVRWIRSGTMGHEW